MLSRQNFIHFFANDHEIMTHHDDSRLSAIEKLTSRRETISLLLVPLSKRLVESYRFLSKVLLIIKTFVVDTFGDNNVVNY